VSAESELERLIRGAAGRDKRTDRDPLITCFEARRLAADIGLPAVAVGVDMSRILTWADDDGYRRVPVRWLPLDAMTLGLLEPFGERSWPGRQ
jgi:hypothetical protein